ncbi:hypothetical protein F975_03024 [Acinetobacter sp. ANC 3789]|uniref:hypothetical protein n=1 Tax=Acinetobacter sp. ANC 3789 TaxID=1217714 RepID=UPI0002D0F1A5|nr:hypothetical protein [Acinetobacter sp. ANC 3789]ENU79054.1 hypothetical protein F975_03024 [Acinetobacter sp. ANC 3789]
MKKIVITFLFCILGITGCEKKKEPEFKAPMGPYGLPYQVGNLGGKPVLLGEESAWLEYEDSPVLRPENRHWWYKAPPRTFDSVITSFGVEMKYTTGLIFIAYHAGPKESREQYYAERDLLNNDWVTIGVNSGIRYHPDLTALFINSTLGKNVRSKENIINTDYVYIYIPTYTKEFGLEKYIPHPEWEKNYGYEDTNDMYIQKDSKGKVITYIQCKNLPIDNPARSCFMIWNLEPFMKVRLQVYFARKHLEDWKIIRERSEKLIKSFVVNPRTLKRSIP